MPNFKLWLPAFVFLTSLLGTSIWISQKERELNLKNSGAAIYNPVPVATGKHSLPTLNTADIKAEAFVVGTASGKIIAEKNKDVKVPIASITKIMTGLLLEERGSDAVIWLTPEAKKAKPKLSAFPAGTILSKDVAATLLLVESDNDIAESIARTLGIFFDAKVSFPRESFIKGMNRKAVSLGMQNTHFANPTGLDSPEHYSTASDIFRLVQYVSQKYPGFWDRTANPPDSVASLSGAKIDLTSSNLLAGYPGLIGGKTGLTDEALGALVLKYRTEYFPEDLIIVILRSADRFKDGEAFLREIEKAFKKSIGR
ncbi:MAG: D-alanyl-D-alanine carboxypeptidase [Candidatus Sungbacteria bacterium]|nr:D-alanyl-D-alanine carboxypeptidase [Candidatus Sungbacteria bacterium]